MLPERPQRPFAHDSREAQSLSAREPAPVRVRALSVPKAVEPQVVRALRRSATAAVRSTIDERIEAVWQLTLECLEWFAEGNPESTPRRSFARVFRPEVACLLVGAPLAPRTDTSRATNDLDLWIA